MREIEPAYGESREKTLYAWWPVIIDRETRWLEYVTVLQVYGHKRDGYNKEWVSVAFIDGDEDKS